jgi:hypothetical protein
MGIFGSKTVALGELRQADLAKDGCRLLQVGSS